MGLLIFVLKVLFMLGAVTIAFLPLLIDYVSFRKDVKKGISYKRFRLVIYTLVYTVAVTLALYFFKEIWAWLSGLSFVAWLANKISVSSRLLYFVDVLVALLINLAIGAIFLALGKLVRIKLKDKDVVTPKEDGEYNWRQRAERAVIKFFYKETWFLVANILKWFNLLLSLGYAAVFLAFLSPAVFSASWIPYDFALSVFNAGYIYPCISLLVLWQVYYFLAGIQRLDEECPEFFEEEAASLVDDAVDIAKIDKACQKNFRKYFGGSINETKETAEPSITEHDEFSLLVGQSISNDSRTSGALQETYLSCADALFAEKSSLLLNGSFFSSFSMYFFRYISFVAARGDNIVIVCKDEEQIEAAYEYVNQGLSKLVSLYCEEFKDGCIDFDHPVWRIVKVYDNKATSDTAAIDDASILITTLNFLCSSDFEKGHESFFHLLNTVIFIDSLIAVNKFSYQLAMLNTRLMHIVERNAKAAQNSMENPNFDVRYMSHQIRYICFDDTRTSGMDKVLKNLLSVDIQSLDCMSYNSSSKIRCYTLDVTNSADISLRDVQFVPTDEQIGPIMNMAILCLAKGAKSISFFSEGVIPYSGIMETITSHTGQISITVDEENIRINKYHYDSNEYSVVIAVDAHNNLPAAVRRYASMVSGSNTLIMILSRPYMLRDFYSDNLASLWKSSQILRIPVEEGSKRDIARKILVRANAGGISEDDIYRFAMGAEAFAEDARNRNLNNLLRSVAEQFGLFGMTDSALLDYFEFSTRKGFSANGKYVCENIVLLRQHGELYDVINGKDALIMIIGENKYSLSISKARASHNFIEGQNLLFSGDVYNIYKIDAANGVIYAKLATGGKNNVPYEYIQDREYRLDFSKKPLEYLAPVRHLRLGGKATKEGVYEAYISNYRVPAEVITRGYYAIDPYSFDRSSADMTYYSIADAGNDFLAKRTYRRYGGFANPTYDTSSNGNSDSLYVKNKGISVLSLKLVCDSGFDVGRVSALATVMLNELLRSMFPSVSDAIVVCPVYADGHTADHEYARTLSKMPKVSFVESDLSESSSRNENHDGGKTRDIEFVIIEDSVCDLGVISGLLASGDDILNTVFAPIVEYLEWYIDKRSRGFDGKKQYLHFGLDKEPECFDFDSLLRIGKAVSNPGNKLEIVDLEPFVEYETCTFCGRRIPKTERSAKFSDGRVMCAECASNLVGNDKKLLRNYLIQARTFLETVYGIKLDREYEVCFDSTLKITNALKKNKNIKRRGSDGPFASYVDTKRKELHVEYDLPGVNLCELLVRELTHLWQINNLPDLAEDLAEGHIALVSVQYLRYVNKNDIAKLRAAHYESNNGVSGLGYRKLSKALVDNPRYQNNPFKYLLEATGGTFEDNRKQTIQEIEDGEYGLPYTPTSPDRCSVEKARHFYYDRIDVSLQRAYDILCEAIEAHREQVTLDDAVTRLDTVVQAIEYDRPDLFYFKGYSYCGNVINLVYHISKSEAESMIKQIEESASKYIEGIDDSMSAYDVALRLHVKMINSVDYDSLALEVEERNSQNGIQREGIDRLRTVCGVLLDRKAVCAGYAKAMQYLLQKCGVESGYIVGAMREENGNLSQTEYHAWNILKMDGDYYLLDTTWDDGSNTDVQKVFTLDYGFDYFGVTTEEMLRSRDANWCPVAIPQCTATRCNYYYHNGCVLDSYDLDKIIVIVETAAKNGSEYCKFKCTSQSVRDEICQRLLEGGEDWKKVLKAAAKQNKSISPNGFSYTKARYIWTIKLIFSKEQK